MINNLSPKPQDPVQEKLDRINLKQKTKSPKVAKFVVGMIKVFKNDTDMYQYLSNAGVDTCIKWLIKIGTGYEKHGVKDWNKFAAKELLNYWTGDKITQGEQAMKNENAIDKLVRELFITNKKKASPPQKSKQIKPEEVETEFLEEEEDHPSLEEQGGGAEYPLNQGGDDEQF